MPELNLLTVNPVTAGIESAQRMEAQRQRGQLLDMQVEDVRARRAQERAATEALNRIYAEGGAEQGTEQVYRRLAADPTVSGSRRLESLKSAEDSALRRTQVEAQARERDARMFKTLLENGMDAAANEVAKRMGMTIPPDFWTNQAKRRALLERLEIEDRQAGISQKRAAAGASQALAESRRRPEYDEYQDDQGRAVRVERGTGKSTFVMGPDGQPIRRANEQGAGRAGARPLDREVRYRMLVEAGVEENEARRIAAGVSMTPGQIAQFRDRAMKRVQTPDPTTGRLRFATPEAQQAEVDRQVQIITDGAGQPGASARQQPAAPTAMDDAEDVPRNADRKVDPNRLVDGKKYRIPLRSGGQTIGQWNAKTGRFDEVQ